MIKVQTIQCNMLQENCHIVSDETTKEAAIIDCGVWYDAEWNAIKRHIDEQRLHPTLLLCTHGHFDHVMGCHLAAKEYGLKPWLHRLDEFLITDLDAQIRQMMGVGMGITFPAAGRWLADGDTLSLGESTLQVLHTPGHTPGGLTFYSEADGMAFTGDTLFRMSVGRTDFEGGSWQQLMKSLKEVIAPLPPSTKLFPGHGPTTTIADELKLNPYMSF